MKLRPETKREDAKPIDQWGKKASYDYITVKQISAIFELIPEFPL